MSSRKIGIDGKWHEFRDNNTGYPLGLSKETIDKICRSKASTKYLVEKYRTCVSSINKIKQDYGKPNKDANES